MRGTEYIWKHFLVSWMLATRYVAVLFFYCWHPFPRIQEIKDRSGLHYPRRYLKNRFCLTNRKLLLQLPTKANEMKCTSECCVLGFIFHISSFIAVLYFVLPHSLETFGSLISVFCRKQLINGFELNYFPDGIQMSAVLAFYSTR